MADQSDVYSVAKSKGDVSIDWDAGADVYKIALVGTGFVFDESQTDLASALGANELAGTGYARQTLSGRAIATTAGTPDIIRHTANNPATYSGANFGQVAGGVVFKELDSGNDALNIPVAYCHLPAPVTTNGGDFTFQFGANGVWIAQ